MILHLYISSRSAAQLLSKKLGATPQYWLGVLKRDRAKVRFGMPADIPFQPVGNRVMYMEAMVYWYIGTHRPTLFSNRPNKRNRFWCSSHVRPSWEHGGELGISLEGRGISVRDTWLRPAEAIELAHELLHHARLIAGRRICIGDGEVVDVPGQTLVDRVRFDQVFSEDNGDASQGSINDPDTVALLESLAVMQGEGGHGA